MAAGAESEGELANRSAFAVAERLGIEPVIFPSDHSGSLGGEYGQTGDPDALRGQTAKRPEGGLTDGEAVNTTPARADQG